MEMMGQQGEARPGGPARSDGTDLTLALERQIARRTQGRLDRIRIVRADGRIVISGRASSQYVKQLALLAIGEVIDPGVVDLDIRISVGDGRASGGREDGREGNSAEGRREGPGSLLKRTPMSSDMSRTIPEDTGCRHYPGS